MPCFLTHTVQILATRVQETWNEHCSVQPLFCTAHIRSIRQGNAFTRVCHSAHGGLYLLPHRTDPPEGRAPLKADPLIRQSTTPQRYGQPAGGTHPTVMHTCSLIFYKTWRHDTLVSGPAPVSCVYMSARVWYWRSFNYTMYWKIQFYRWLCRYEKHYSSF